MEPLHLRVLQEVAARGSIAAAADALGYTPPAVSRHLMILERDVGQTLVDRTPKGAQLTIAGQALLVHADRILAQIEAARAAMAQLGEAEDRRVRVATFRGALLTFIPEAARRIRERPGTVELGVEVRDAVDALRAVRQGTVDVALANQEVVRGPDDTVALAPLMEDELVCLLPAGHALAGGEHVALDALRGETFALGGRPGCPTDAQFRNACQTSGFSPQETYASGDHEVAFGLVASGLAVSVVPRLSVPAPAHLGGVVRLPFRDPLVLRVAMITRAADAGSGALKLACDALRSAAVDYVDTASVERPPPPGEFFGPPAPVR
ncbi:MAG: LysR family transcriptional regulator [Solirubrobacteraceae bacterium]|nr:LysR family transcriptional regulator [Solirubrobacteraceae bacterium]